MGYDTGGEAKHMVKFHLDPIGHNREKYQIKCCQEYFDYKQTSTLQQ